MHSIWVMAESDSVGRKWLLVLLFAMTLSVVILTNELWLYLITVIALAGFVVWYAFINPWKSFLAFAFLAPIVPNAIAFSADPTLTLLTFQRIALVLLLLAAAVRIVTGKRPTLEFPKGSMLLSLFVAVMFGSVVYSLVQPVSMKEYFSERVIGLPLLFILAYSLIANTDRAKIILRYIAITSLFVAAIALIEFFSGVNLFEKMNFLPQGVSDEIGIGQDIETRLDLYRVKSVFQHPIALGVYGISVLSVALPFQAFARRRRERILWILVILSCVVTILSTVSRGPFLTMCLLFLLFAPRSKTMWLLILTIVALGYGFLAEKEFLVESSLMYRGTIVTGLVEYYNTIPFFGVGLNVFRRAAIDSEKVLGLVDPLAFFIVLFVESGILAVITFWAFLTKLVINLKKGLTGILSRQLSVDQELVRLGLWNLILNLVLAFFSVSMFNGSQLLMMHFIVFAALLRLANGQGMSSLQNSSGAS
jgi:hypothetical protein